MTTSPNLDTATGDRDRRTSERSTAELASDFARQMAALVHHEMELAKVELSEKGKRAGAGAGALGLSAVVALVAFGCLTTAAIAALQVAWPLWLSALVMGAAYLVVAGIAALAGRRELTQAGPPVPTEALEHSKEDVQWLKMQAESARR